jgi:predicted phage terminase large subunit-like protein
MSAFADAGVDIASLKLPEPHKVFLRWQDTWLSTARPKQLMPAGDWTEWGIKSGRGFGKTRAGAEWLGADAWLDPEALPRAVIAPTYSDVRFTCFEGPAGLLSCIPSELRAYNSSDLIITLTNGATIRGFTSEKPDRLRGPEHAAIWCDEIAAWQYADETWDMALLGLRVGKARIAWTTTPKPTDLFRRLIVPKPGRIIVSGSTYDNRANLSDTFYEQISQYEGTVLGRQEILGELIDSEESGIVKRSQFRLWPADKPLPRLKWIVMSLDTAFTEATIDKKTHDADFSACTVWGGFDHVALDGDERANVILLDCWQERYGLPELVARVRKELNVAYGDDQEIPTIRPLIGAQKLATSGRKPDIVVIEDKGSGISLRQVLEREGVFAYAYNPGHADKLARLHIVSPIFARKQVWLPESNRSPGQPRTWVEPLLAQLCSFSGSKSIKHDDFVDSTTQALRLLMDKGMLSAKLSTKKTADYDEPVHPRNVVRNPYAA